MSQPYEVFCPVCGDLLFGEFRIAQVTVNFGRIVPTLNAYQIEHECKEKK